MGKPTGFLEVERKTISEVEPLERIKNWNEFKIPPGSNSGVYLQGRYEVQVLDSHGQPPKKNGCAARRRSPSSV